MDPWYRVVTPRKEVREGRSFNPDEFAIHLEQVVSDRAPDDYRDPTQFFARTVFTRAVREQVEIVLRRLHGQTEGAPPVLALVTQFGGGKTHILTALYHLVEHPEESLRNAQVSAVVKGAGLSGVPKSRWAVFVGNAWDPQPGRETPWIDLARQLAGDAGVAALGMDARESPPGTQALGRVFEAAGGRVLILMDEVLNFLNRRKAMADLFYAFLDNLVRTATGMKGCVAVISLPRSRIEMASEWDMEWQDRITRIIRRVARELLANDESEISEVVRRRLFEDLGAERTRRSIARAYADWCFQWRAQLPSEWTAVEAGTTDVKAQELLRRRFEACYPFHPATLSVFQRKWQTVPQYQQTRGTLAMFAQWISWVYREDHLRARREPLITLGSAPLEVPEFRATVVGQLGEHRLIPAIEHDIAGERSHARALDADTKGPLRDIHRRVGTGIFFESSGGMVDKVAHLPELRFALGEPDLDIASIDNAADALERRAFYLRKVGADGYRFGFRATLKKVVADRRASLDEQRDVQPAVRQLVRSEFERGATLPVVPFPKDGAAVPDTPQLTIVVMDPEFEWDGTEDPQARIAEWTRQRGAETRRYPAALVWCVKKPGRSLQDQVETLLAWRRVADELRAGLLSSEVEPAETQEAAGKVKAAETDAREEIWASYGYLVVADRGVPAGVKVIDLAGGYSNAGQTLTGRILATLKTEGLFTESVGAGYVGRNWPVALRETGVWPLQGLRQSFLDGSLVRLVDPERTLREQIVRWVEAGEFGLASGRRPDGTFQRVWFKEPVATEEVTFDAQTFLLTKEKAVALTRPPELAVPEPGQVSEEQPVAPLVQIPGGPTPREVTITLRVHGSVSPEVWNRLGVRLIPKLKSGQNLSLSFDAVVQAQGELGRHLEQDVRQALSELGLGDLVTVDIDS
jgi:hypothetical protein